MAEGQESQDSGARVSEAQIAVHWREEETCPPPPGFVEQANAADPAIFDRFSEEHFPDCFAEYADLLTWGEPWHTTLDTSDPPDPSLNQAVSCAARCPRCSR
jgi:acetyl-CoA synthetase